MTKEQYAKLKVGDEVCINDCHWIKGKVVAVKAIKSVSVRYENQWNREVTATVHYPEELRTPELVKQQSDAYCRFLDSLPEYGSLPPCPDGNHQWFDLPPYGRKCTKCGDLTDE